MTRIQIAGNIPLKGELHVQGSKNAALPMMAAAVLHNGQTILHNCPRILDVEYMTEILKELGCLVQWHGHSLEIDAKELCSCQISASYASRLRASVTLMGSVLGRCKEAAVPYPGGCSIGKRPVDMHLYAMEQLGVQIQEEDGVIRLDGKHMEGNEIRFLFPSVGATENAILAAILTDGVTRIYGCATEPEILDLCRFLNAKGARIRGIGTGTLMIRGVKSLHDSEYTLMPDRIVVGTYLCAAAGTRGQIRLSHVLPEQLRVPLQLLQQSGAKIESGTDWVWIDGRNADACIRQIETMPYPGFPTDLQSQMITILTVARGVSRLSENLFESRFLVIKELRKMGAKIKIEHKTATITGVPHLQGAEVCATDLRGGAALVLAGLMAHGNTIVEGCHLIDRGYEDICRDLQQLGADICRL